VDGEITKAEVNVDKEQWCDFETEMAAALSVD